MLPGRRATLQAQEMLKMLEAGSKKLQDLIPEQMDRFWSFGEKVKETGHLSKREKSLIALAVVAVKRCEPCVARNLKDAIDAGVKIEDLAELCGLIMLLDGGPGFAAGTFLLEKYEELVSDN
jgi:AhpD family alkylhydroperoxidase